MSALKQLQALADKILTAALAAKFETQSFKNPCENPKLTQIL